MDLITTYRIISLVELAKILEGKTITGRLSGENILSRYSGFKGDVVSLYKDNLLYPHNNKNIYIELEILKNDIVEEAINEKLSTIEYFIQSYNIKNVKNIHYWNVNNNSKLISLLNKRQKTNRKSYFEKDNFFDKLISLLPYNNQMILRENEYAFFVQILANLIK